MRYSVGDMVIARYCWSTIASDFGNQPHKIDVIVLCCDHCYAQATYKPHKLSEEFQNELKMVGRLRYFTNIDPKTMKCRRCGSKASQVLLISGALIGSNLVKRVPRKRK